MSVVKVATISVKRGFPVNPFAWFVKFDDRVASGCKLVENLNEK